MQNNMFNIMMIFENFYEGSTYKHVVTVAKTVAMVPCRKNSPLIFYGPEGVGKTHFLPYLIYSVYVILIAINTLSGFLSLFYHSHQLRPHFHYGIGIQFTVFRRFWRAVFLVH